MRVPFSGGVRLEICPIDLVSANSASCLLLGFLFSKRPDGHNSSRSDERDDPLHSCHRDPHIRMALRSIEILTHSSDGDIRVSHFGISSWRKKWGLIHSRNTTPSSKQILLRGIRLPPIQPHHGDGRAMGRRQANGDVHEYLGNWGAHGASYIWCD